MRQLEREAKQKKKKGPFSNKPKSVPDGTPVAEDTKFTPVQKPSSQTEGSSSADREDSKQSSQSTENQEPVKTEEQEQQPTTDNVESTKEVEDQTVAAQPDEPKTQTEDAPNKVSSTDECSAVATNESEPECVPSDPSPVQAEPSLDNPTDLLATTAEANAAVTEQVEQTKPVENEVMCETVESKADAKETNVSQAIADENSHKAEETLTQPEENPEPMASTEPSLGSTEVKSEEPNIEKGDKNEETPAAEEPSDAPQQQAAQEILNSEEVSANQTQTETIKDNTETPQEPIPEPERIQTAEDAKTEEANVNEQQTVQDVEHTQLSTDETPKSDEAEEPLSKESDQVTNAIDLEQDPNKNEIGCTPDINPEETSNETEQVSDAAPIINESPDHTIEQPKQSSTENTSVENADAKSEESEQLVEQNAENEETSVNQAAPPATGTSPEMSKTSEKSCQTELYLLQDLIKQLATTGNTDTPLEPTDKNNLQLMVVENQPTEGHVDSINNDNTTRQDAEQAPVTAAPENLSSSLTTESSSMSENKSEELAVQDTNINNLQLIAVESQPSERLKAMPDSASEEPAAQDTTQQVNMHVMYLTVTDNTCLPNDTK